MTSHPSRQHLPESIEARAAAWLAQRDDGLSPDEARAFAVWRAENPQHEAAVLRLERAWTAMQQLRHFRPEALQHPDRDLLAPRRPAKVTHFPLRPVLAAAAALALVTTAFFYWPSNPQVPLNPAPESQPIVEHYSTTAHGYQRATLPDGSTVELNENSEMTTRLTSQERRVDLIRGEIHFTVAKDANRPFRVIANGVEVRAVGTAFNVRLTPTNVEVLVTEGTVSLHDVTPQHTDANVTAPLVTVGQQAFIRLDETGMQSQVSSVPQSVITNALSWQGARLVFVDSPLSEAVARFNQRNTVQIEIADPKIADLKIGGGFQADNIEGFIRLISSNPDIHVERPTANRVILRGSR